MGNLVPELHELVTPFWLHLWLSRLVHLKEQLNRCLLTDTFHTRVAPILAKISPSVSGHMFRSNDSICYSHGD